jgi:XTP/dITP diphosphohydrolase
MTNLESGSNPAGQRPVLLLASTNKGKLRELRELFAAVELPVQIRTPDDYPGITEPEETGQTFAENACLKALYYCQQTGIPALADDSGLEIDALDGRPGVLSARYASSPQEAIDRVLSELLPIPIARRTARFHCAMALACPNEGIVAESDGVVEGVISYERQGSGGFGYDPIFLVNELPEQPSMAQLDPAEKNKISHRGRAIRSLLPALLALYHEARSASS